MPMQCMRSTYACSRLHVPRSSSSRTCVCALAPISSKKFKKKERIKRLGSASGGGFDGDVTVVLSGIDRVLKLLFNAQELIILGETLRTARGSTLDLARGESHGNISDEIIFRFSTTVGGHNAPS
mmetsp:Transcript_6219/g.11427  ORF Transcript_6219/g.11427 Transcript_6219/m.11427 type:complete len:125 (+) Transcript_6219:144-518(+)